MLPLAAEWPSSRLLLVGAACALACGAMTPRHELRNVRTLVAQMPFVRGLATDGDHAYWTSYRSKDVRDDEYVDDGRVSAVALRGGGAATIVRDPAAPEMIATAGDRLAWYRRAPARADGGPSYLMVAGRDGRGARAVAERAMQVGGGFAADARHAWFTHWSEIVEVDLTDGRERVVAKAGGYTRDLAPADGALIVVEDRVSDGRIRSAIVRVDLATGASRDLFESEPGYRLHGLAIASGRAFSPLYRLDARDGVDPGFGAIVVAPLDGGAARPLLRSDRRIDSPVARGDELYFVRGDAIERYDLRTGDRAVLVTEPSTPTDLRIAGESLVWMTAWSLRAGDLTR